MYKVIISKNASKGMEKHIKSGDKITIKKLEKLLEELKDHPTTGTGKPKQLSGDRVGQWSRRITDKHRLIYEIIEDKVIVLVISVWGHYDDD